MICSNALENKTLGFGGLNKVDELYVQELLDELADAGVIRHNGRYRNGQPVYVLVPDEELSETAKAMIKTMAKHRPN